MPCTHRNRGPSQAACGFWPWSAMRTSTWTWPWGCIGAAHHPEAHHRRAVFGDKARDDRVVGTLVRPDLVRMSLSRSEIRATVLQRNAGARHHHTGAESHVVRLDHRHHHSRGIGGGEIHGAPLRGCRRRPALPASGRSVPRAASGIPCPAGVLGAAACGRCRRHRPARRRKPASALRSADARCRRNRLAARTYRSAPGFPARSGPRSPGRWAVSRGWCSRGRFR